MATAQVTPEFIQQCNQHSRITSRAFELLQRFNAICHWNALAFTIEGGDRGSTEWSIRVSSPAPAEEFTVKKWSTMEDVLEAALKRLESDDWPAKEEADGQATR